MPQRVTCNDCGCTLYQGPDLKPPDEIISWYKNGCCPDCGKKINWKPINTIVKPAEGELETICPPDVKRETREVEYKHTVERRQGKYRFSYDIQATILVALEKGIPLKKVFNPKGRYFSPKYRKILDNLVSMGYVEKDANKVSKTGDFILHAYKTLKSISKGEDVEYTILGEDVKELAFNLSKNIKHRCKYDTYFAILNEAKEPKNKNCLMKNARINTSFMNRFLPELIEAGLIQDIGENNFKTTERGQFFINQYLYFILFEKGGTNEDKWEILD
jgi:predicted transcriptional regulator/ribosomal protein S19E (S16A)/DNA-directed RNA polymerase subunit RPC12/RpoP